MIVGLAVVQAAACGARSTLYPGEIDGEGGGGTGGTGGTGAGGTGAGGTTSTTTTDTTTTTTTTTTTVVEGPCGALKFETPYSHLDGGLQVNQRGPKLGYASDDGMTVTLASAWQATEGPGNLPIELRHTSFEPWGAFPAGSGFGPTFLADLDAGVSFSITQGKPGRFALLFRDFKSPPPGGLRFSADFKPKSGTVPASILADSALDDALFARRGTTGKWLLGGRDQVGMLSETRFLSASESQVEASIPVTCTTAPAAADAVAVNGGFVATVAAPGGGPSSCANGNGSPIGGPLVLSIQGVSVSLTGDLAKGSPADIAMAPRKDGAWVAWLDTGAGALSAGTWVSAVSEKGIPLGVPFNANLACEPQSLAAASFEGFLMIACIQSEPEGASPVVQVFEPDGTPAAGLKVPATGAAKGRAALIGSPVSRSAVLAWSETAGIGDQIRITRLDCVDGP
ncbi:MAG: hypothetical protein R3F14_16080 [Polyangiaceae bacterium]